MLLYHCTAETVRVCNPSVRPSVKLCIFESYKTDVSVLGNFVREENSRKNNFFLNVRFQFQRYCQIHASAAFTPQEIHLFLTSISRSVDPRTIVGLEGLHQWPRRNTKLFMYPLWCGPGSSVGIVTDYGLDSPGSNPGGDEIFRTSRLALGPTQPPLK